ncbi:MAG: hypothetical protein BGO14_10810 [Chlamydiales bacterium 38-26]|nr:UTP--glucose-1-phosphate uridylyltransferase [Chlamydiales bacterium]OJV11443.1 MAG: hypothetical protein BGO14_10810 [Chlamydiales bacterium 38-26]
MQYEAAYSKLESIGQTQLLDYWQSLNAEEKDTLLSQIENLDIELFLKQKAILQHPPVNLSASFEPFEDFKSCGSAADEKLGKELIHQGKMACLIVAGGQATRLNLQGPKGLYPISNIRNKSLFQIFAEKVVCAGKQAGNALQLAIMTSPINHEMTTTYFKAHHFFGLKINQVHFFSQKMLPYLDDVGNLFLEKKGKIAEGPDGNGAALYNLWTHGIISLWKSLGIEYVNFIMIDNPLADPFDAELLGYHVRNQQDITVKCILKNNPEEKVGVLVKQDDKIKVIEYSEMSASERSAQTSSGSLRHACANISLFCISMSFIEKICQQGHPLPLHPAYKTAPNLLNTQAKAWKFEHFIFDILPLANKVGALLYPREYCFAPLKNLAGNDSPETVKKALQKRDQKIYEELFNHKAPPEPFELAQDFYYPTPSLMELWKGKTLFNDRYLGDP